VTSAWPCRGAHGGEDACHGIESRDRLRSVALYSLHSPSFLQLVVYSSPAVFGVDTANGYRVHSSVSSRCPHFFSTGDGSHRTQVPAPEATNPEMPCMQSRMQICRYTLSTGGEEICLQHPVSARTDSECREPHCRIFSRRPSAKHSGDKLTARSQRLAC
jgi:hypothetical protein